MNKIFSKIDAFFEHNWQIGILRKDSGCQTIKPDPAFIPYLKAQNARKHHILIKPKKEIETFFLLIDDLNMKNLKEQHQFLNGSWKPGRFVIESSPENFQVWLHFSSSVSLSKKIALLKDFNSDPACYPKGRFGRCPGFRNTKQKYLLDNAFFPLARLIWIDFVHYADSFPKFYHKASMPSRKDYDKNNESQTDFAFALALLRRGFSDIEIKNHILAERVIWDNHNSEYKKQDYLDRTIGNAKLLISN